MISEIVISVLLFTTFATLGKFSSPPPNDVTYEELDSLELTCGSLDNCQRNRATDDLTLFNCHCGASCSLLGTCCVDSEFRTSGIEPNETNVKCLTTYDLSVFMVDSCEGDTLAQELCLSDAETSNDPFLLIPVTSSRTGISYKNYFCAACNEDTEVAPPRFWSLKLLGKSELAANLAKTTLLFNSTLRSWMALDESTGGTPIPVSVRVVVPDELAQEVKKCRPGVVSKCSDVWSDVSITEKCQSSYMGIVVYHRNETTVRYKNPHCAICNFEDPYGFECAEMTMTRAKPGGVSDSLFVGLFSFDDKTKRCRDNMVYDKFADKCRAVRCGRRQTVVDGRCA